jgi:uncharacterized repeat protein (TIGR01451 family)
MLAVACLTARVMVWAGRRLTMAIALASLAAGVAPARPAAAVGTADVFVSLSGPATVFTGGLISYTVIVGNAGPDAATNVVLTDPLPAGTVFQPTTSNSCWQLNGGVLTCTTAAGANTVLLSLTAPTSPGTVTDTVSISASEGDPNPANNTSTLSTEVQTPTLADISTSILADPTTVVVGGSLTYVVEVINSGPAQATGVVASISLPPSMVDTGSHPLPSGCSVDAAGIVTCSFGFPFPPRSIALLTFGVNATEFGTFDATATVSADEPDPNTANNSSSATVVVLGDADLALAVQGPGQVFVQSSITYSLTVTNAGPDDARDTVLMDQIAPITALTGWSSSQGSCSNPSPGVLRCDLGTLASGSTATVSVTAFTLADGTATNSASVTSDNRDPNAANNAGSATTTVLPESDLAVGLSTDATARQGSKSTVTLTGTVTNNGPSDALGATATHQLASTLRNLDVASATASQGSCSVIAGNVTCQLGTLAAGAEATVAVALTAWGTGSVTDTFGASARDLDPFPENNVVTQSVSVN